MDVISAAPRRRISNHRAAAVLIALCAAFYLVGCSDASTSDDAAFEGLTPGQRVYDRTDNSLNSLQAADIERLLDNLKSETGADVIAYVRELDADSDDTLDQVEELQQRWVSATGVDQDIAGAILINREPGKLDEARAGIFLGTTYDDGNVPRDEQEAIVEQALIPPLRDGDVAGSLTAGIDRLGSDIRNGPPVTALDRFAEGSGSTWLPWAGSGIALLGLLVVASVFRGRAKPTVSQQSPTTVRPDQATDAAYATALVHRSAQPSGVPGTVLALAAAEALTFEQDKKPGRFDKGTVSIRLLDRTRARGEVQQMVWSMLAARAVGDVVPGEELKKISRGPGATKELVEARLRSSGFVADGTARRRAVLAGLGVLGAAAAIGGIAVATSGAPTLWFAVVLSAVLFVAGLSTAIAYSRFSVAGLDAARPWEAYRDGLKQAAKDADESVDLNAALPDIIALGLAPSFRKQLDAATDPASDSPLEVFTSPAGANYAAGGPVVLPWAAFSGVFVSSSSGSVASGGGAGGGGGAAGST
ncbi:TPM domain-containing protein [Rhodococcus sp. KRD162]|uniref:TPM domain-containing protein n=1 Tax=Rhodococcus sp. KRD162 TaxID=2729725 RepID=UPI0019D079B7|nr:TPM domain-containing protein [Rhodococcus sp. KRD162]